MEKVYPFQVTALGIVKMSAKLAEVLCVYRKPEARKTVKNDENNVQFGTSVMVITREGSFLGNFFKNNVEGAQLFMDIPNFKWGR